MIMINFKFIILIYVVLSYNGLEILARMGQQAKKSSRRDLAYVVSQVRIINRLSYLHMGCVG